MRCSQGQQKGCARAWRRDALAGSGVTAGRNALPGAALNRNLSWKVGAPCVSTLRGLWKEILWLWGHVSLPSNHSSRLSSDLWSQPTQRESHWTLTSFQLPCGRVQAGRFLPRSGPGHFCRFSWGGQQPLPAVWWAWIEAFPLAGEVG